MLLFGCTQGYVRHALSGAMCFTNIPNTDFSDSNSVLPYDSAKLVMSSPYCPNLQNKNYSKTALLILQCFRDS